MARTIRVPEPQELRLIADVERSAGQMFAGAGMPNIAAHAPTPLEDLKEHQAEGLILIALEGSDIVGFATLNVLGDHAHLDQMAVAREHGRHGHGTRLLEAACELARQRGYDTITLTTFRDIPWNAPFYAQRGFKVIPEDDLSPELRAQRDLEQTYGLDPELRVVMRREL